MIITPEDESQLKLRGLTSLDLLEQIELFTKRIQPVKLEKPCITGDGILRLNSSECNFFLEYYEEHKQDKSIQGFIPASGAASRMFRHLQNYNADTEDELTEEFILHFSHFAFTGLLAEVMAENGENLEEAVAQNNWQKIFSFILHKPGLGYSSQLKGMVGFHRYGEGVRTAFEEHVHQFLKYGRQSDGKCRIHFTVSPQHLEDVSEFMEMKLEEFPYEDIELSYSIQQPATDTIALTTDNVPLRGEDNSLVFRPGGHGALIRNLQSLDADIIFIRNIDNVSIEGQSAETVYYKKILAGVLLEVKHEINRLLDKLESQDESVLEEALEFIHTRIQPGVPIGQTIDELLQYARLRLDRPLRICGMVKNEGEPGGGPFWVKTPMGNSSKQIVEKSQLDGESLQQQKIFNSGTHFNPVDIVCSIKNRKGESYVLENFMDPSTGFVAEKFQKGKIIKALEHPGLWNGAMALWNTIFVEVPISTFNPVKTVNDLLRPGHQA